jgi:hypothetical protein
MNLFYKSVLLWLLIVGSILANTSAHAIVCSGLSGNGSTDDSTAFNECMVIAAGEKEKTVNLPAGTYKLSSTLTVPEEVAIVGASGATINGTLKLSNYSKLNNINFLSRSRSVIIGETGTPYITGAEVRDCTFGNGTWSSLFMGKSNDAIIDGNTFIGIKGSREQGAGGNITICGGKRNQITNNYIYGGITSIIFKWSLQQTGGGYESMLEDNVVTGNTIEAFREEGITFDISGNSRDSVMSREYDTISSVGTNQVTLSHANWQNSGIPSYIGYDMVFMDGALAGRTRRITKQTGAVFTLDESVSGAVSGDAIVIGATFKNNYVANNTVISDNAGSILLFGMAFENIIERNTITDGGNIEIRSLNNVERASPTVTGTWGRAPCGYNIVRNNSTAGRASAFLYVIPTINGHDNTNAAFYSYGNSIKDNTCSKVISIRQYIYITGNSGPSELYYTTLLKENDVIAIIPPKIIDITRFDSK